MGRVTVNIRSKLHPAGKLYALADIGDLAPAELERLEKIAERAQHLRGSRFRKDARASRLCAQAVAIVLPTLEPDVLRAMRWEDQIRVLDEWSGVAA